MFLKLKSLLIINEIGQRELADILKLSVTTINNKINGKTEFTLSEAKKVSSYFKMSIEEIFE